MSEKYKHAFAAVRRDKRIGDICKAAGVSPMTFHSARFRRETIGKGSAQRIYGALNAYGYLPRCASFEEMFPRHASEKIVLEMRMAKPAVYEHSLAALWLKWKTSPLIIRDLYENGSPKIREQAKVYLQNVSLAPRRTGTAIEMRNFAREWVEKQEMQA